MAIWPPFRAPTLAAVLAACQTPFLGPPDATPPSEDPMVYDPAEVRRAGRIAVFVPGAFASTAIFGPPDDWRAAGVAPVFYRLPGMDGLPADHALRIEDAAARIATLVETTDARDVLLVGYSTGGPVALTAARRLRPGRSLHLALVAPAVERAGGIETRLRGFRHMVEAAARAGSIDPAAFWPAYWQTLLFGPANLGDPAFAARIAAITEENAGLMAIPTPDLAQRHTADLQNWTLSPGARARPVDARIAIFAGAADPVFSTAQTLAFAERIGGAAVHLYPGDGHLPVLTRADLWTDVRAFADRG